MIRNFFIFIIILLLVIIPNMKEDAFEFPSVANDEHINIEAKLITEHPEIGKKFKFELTITNLTNKRIELKQISSSDIFTEHFYSVNNSFVSSLKLRAHESITFEITGKISEHIEWYKKGEDYYLDFKPGIAYYLSCNDTLFYQSINIPYSLKIDNLYDGGQYIALEWENDSKTMYYMKDYEHLLSSENLYATYGVEINNGVYCTNLSHTKIDELEPNETKYMHIYSSSLGGLERIKDTEQYDYHHMFQIGDDYYVSSIYREYKTVILNTPEIKLSYNLEKSDSGADIYKFVIYNNDEYALENFVFTSDNLIKNSDNEKYYSYGTLYPDDEWTISLPVSADPSNNIIFVGYLIDGLLYLWSVDYEFNENKNSIDVYEWLSFHSYALDINPDDETPINETQNISTESGNMSGLFQSSLLQNLDSEDEINSQIKIIRRHGNRTWLYALIGVSVLTIAGVIVLLCRKKIKNLNCK